MNWGKDSRIGTILKKYKVLHKTLGVFLKEPIPGKVKTRLSRTVGKERAAEIYSAFASDSLERSARVRNISRWVFYSPPSARSACSLLAGRLAGRFCFFPQAGGCLGRRIAKAFEHIFTAGAALAVIIGSDIPQVGEKHIRGAFQALESVDLVLGPSLDGGYYLIGIRADRATHLRSLLRSIPWSTRKVLAETIRRARRAGLSFQLLEPLLDVDIGSDLRRLSRALRRSSESPADRAELPLRTSRVLGILSRDRGGRNRSR